MNDCCYSTNNVLMSSVGKIPKKSVFTYFRLLRCYGVLSKLTCNKIKTNHLWKELAMFHNLVLLAVWMEMA